MIWLQPPTTAIIKADLYLFTERRNTKREGGTIIFELARVV
jgi:hypothetical protein